MIPNSSCRNSEFLCVLSATYQGRCVPKLRQSAASSGRTVFFCTGHVCCNGSAGDSEKKKIGCYIGIADVKEFQVRWQVNTESLKNGPAGFSRRQNQMFLCAQVGADVHTLLTDQLQKVFLDLVGSLKALQFRSDSMGWDDHDPHLSKCS